MYSELITYGNGLYDEKPRLLNLESLKTIATEAMPLFKKANAPISFKGLEETYKKYALLTNDDILGLHLIRCEFNAWVEHLEMITIMATNIQNNYILKADYLDSLKDEQAEKYNKELKENQEAIKKLEDLKKTIAKHIKKIEECDAYCKKNFNKQVRIYGNTSSM